MTNNEPCTCTKPTTTPLDPNGNMYIGSFGSICPPCAKRNLTEQAEKFERSANGITKLPFDPDITLEQVEKAFRDRATELRNQAANIDMND